MTPVKVQAKLVRSLQEVGPLLEKFNACLQH